MYRDHLHLRQLHPRSIPPRVRASRAAKGQGCAQKKALQFLSKDEKMQERRERRGVDTLNGGQVAFLVLTGVLSCVLICLVVAFMCWAAIVLVDSSSYKSPGSCGLPLIWLFALLASLLIAVSVATGGGKDAAGNVGLLGFLQLGLTVGLTLWGVALWVGMEASLVKNSSKTISAGPVTDCHSIPGAVSGDIGDSASFAAAIVRDPAPVTVPSGGGDAGAHPLWSRFPRPSCASVEHRLFSCRGWFRARASRDPSGRVAE